MASNPTEQAPVSVAPSGDTLFTARTRGRSSNAGLDVLLTKASIDFQSLAAERDDPQLKQNLEALRDAAGLDAILIATFDEAGANIDHVAAASSQIGRAHV